MLRVASRVELFVAKADLAPVKNRHRHQQRRQRHAQEARPKANHSNVTDLHGLQCTTCAAYMFFTATRVALFSSFQSVFESPDAMTNGSFSSSSNVLQIAAMSFR